MPNRAIASEDRALLKRAIGLTGGIATGKSEAALYIARWGFTVVDADQVARAVVAKGSAVLAQISREFGSEFLAADGTMDRSRMRSLIARDPSARQRLESLTHPAIRQETLSLVRTQEWNDAAADLHQRLWFYEASLLIEAGVHGDFAEIWLTNCTPKLQLERLVGRDGMSPVDAKRLIGTQWPAARKAKYATEIIDTNGDLAHVHAQIDELLKRRGFHEIP